MRPSLSVPCAAAGIACFRGDAVLLVKRGKAPRQGQWSIPGGRIEWGESAKAAALRELHEETGCSAELIGLVDVVDALIRDKDKPAAGAAITAHYVLIDYAARWLAGEPRAGDDAIDARFFSPSEIESLGLWSETKRVIDAARIMAAAGR